MKITFKHSQATKLSHETILRQAKVLRKHAPFPMTLQQAVDCVIDAAIEHAQ